MNTLKKCLLLTVLIILAGGFINVSKANATTAGPNSAGTAVDAGFGDGTISWVNPTNVYSANSTYATVTTSIQSERSHYMKVSNFGFSIPASQAVTMIRIEMLGHSENGLGLIFANPTKDVTVSCCIGGWYNVQLGAADAYATIDQYISTGLFSSNVNSANFGAWIETAPHAAGSGGVWSVDHVRLTLTYQANDPPTITAGPTVSYGSGTRTGPNNPTFYVNFTPYSTLWYDPNAITYYVRTSGTWGAGTQVATGTGTRSQAVSAGIQYNASGMSNGSNPLYVHLYDGQDHTVTAGSVTVLRDDVAPTSSTSINTTPSPVTSTSYTVTFTPNDASSTNTNEINYSICTANDTCATPVTGGTGTSTSGQAKTTGTITDSGLVVGSNNRWIRTCDGANNCTNTAFTVTYSPPLGSPTAVTTTQTAVNTFSTQLNGTVNPNGVATVGFFLWDTSNGSCQDFRFSTASQAITAVFSPVTLIDASTSNPPIIAGLVPGSNYYYCAVGINSMGIQYGNVITFVQPQGSACMGVPSAANYTMSSSCVFPNPNVDGVDKGTGTTNDGILTLSPGQTLTLAAGQTVGFGFLYKPGANIVRGSGATFRIGPVWIPDTDGDGYPDFPGTKNQIVSATQPTGYVRRAVAGTNLPVDCAPYDATTYRIKPAYPDNDNDGFTATSFAQPICVGASYTSVSSGADCNDNINDTYGYAWGENVGWINFANCQGTVNASSTELTGYAWGENVGWISLNCSNTSSCGTVNYKVANTNGTLSGYAWAENAGWISFNCSNTSSCGTVNYGVTIDSTGIYSGYAWGENIGWISFNCSNTSSCGTVNYSLKGAWHP